jgi:hypothetical protein
VAPIDERRKMPTGLCLEKLRDRGNLEDLYVDGSVVLKFRHLNVVGRAWTGLTWLMIRTWVAGCCEHGYELSSSKNTGDCLTT